MLETPASTKGLVVREEGVAALLGLLHSLDAGDDLI